MAQMEMWRPIDGFEGLYEVSNIGNVRSLNYHNSGVIKNLTPVSDKDGYLIVCMSKGTKQFTMRVHRLVATAFVDNPHNLSQVNHLNEVKSDNRADNLDWVTCRENNNYGTRNQRMSQSKRNKNCKPIIQLTLDGKVVKEWVSLNEVKRRYGYDTGLLSKVCKGRKMTAYGYKWQYAI